MTEFRGKKRFLEKAGVEIHQNSNGAVNGGHDIDFRFQEVRKGQVSFLASRRFTGSDF